MSDDDRVGLDHRQKLDAVVEMVDHRPVALGLAHKRAGGAARDHAVEMQ
ncbi:MAG: hypothetical protein ACREFH_18320 [Stellaceae bacterium]